MKKTLILFSWIFIILGCTNRGVSESDKNVLWVKGSFIDILTIAPTQKVFPQNRTFHFSDDIPSYLLNKKYAVSLLDYDGVEQIKSSINQEIYIATHYDTLSCKDWEYTGDKFSISSSRSYYVYKTNYLQTKEWLNIPQPANSELAAPTLVFADSIFWSNPLPLPQGTVVIGESEVIKQVRITNPSIAILPNGNYISSCSGTFRLPKEPGRTSIFESTDKGKMWNPLVKNGLEINYGNLFVHRNTLYMMGTKGIQKEIIIIKSVDNGRTWTTPTDNLNGLLLAGQYHTAPVPTVVHNGRIWRAFESNRENYDDKKIFVMSAPEESDLLDASSWTSTNELAYDTSWITEDGKIFKQWLEGNVVVDPEGNIVNVLRVDENTYGGVSAIARVTSSTKLTFDPQKDIINLPGGGKKYTLRYDSISKKYWTLTNVEFEQDRNASHSGIYNKGIHTGLLRNRLVLLNSADLRTWIQVDTLLSSNNPFFHGFQYLDWQIDGNDLVAVCRMAYDRHDGLPERQHDANYFTFHRFADFRNRK